MHDDPTNPHEPTADPATDGAYLPEGDPPPEPQDSQPAIPVARPVFGVPAGSLERPIALRAGDPLHLPALSRAAVLVDLAIMAVALVAFEGLTALVVLSLLGPDFDFESPSGMESLSSALLPIVVGRAVVVVVVVASIIKLRRMQLASVGAQLNRFFLNAVIGVVAAPVCGAIVFGVMMTLILLVPGAYEAQVENVGRLDEMIPNISLLAAFGLACTIGVYEELLFRGFIMPRIRRLTGGWFTAVLLTTAVFTALHASDQVWTALVAVSMLSILFSVLTIFTRSIIPSIVAHMLWDFTIFVMLLTNLMGEPPSKETVIAQLAALPWSLAIEGVAYWPM